MKRIAEKVVLVALICITFVFALTTILYAADVIPQVDVSSNGVTIILLTVLGAVYVGLSSYLVYVTFSESINVKRIMLFYDTKSATRANSKVVDNIVKGCAKTVKEIKIRRTVLRVDDKLGLVANIHIEVDDKDITENIEKLRSLLDTSFQQTLGLQFNAINFEIDKLRKKFVPKTTTPTEEVEASSEQTNETEQETTETPQQNETVEVVAEQAESEQAVTTAVSEDVPA